MERMLRNRDHILFGHQSPGAFSGEEVRGAPRTSADVDFSDVFGGPPMTSAAFEGLHGFSKSANASLSGAAGEEFIAAEEAAMRRWRWSTSHVENDGVGETDSPGRRRNFANESASSTPRRTNEHSTSSLSSSAVLSSADPAPPPIDRRSGGASFAAHLSDPVISIQGSDSPGIISPRANTAEKTDRNAPANARRSARTKNQPRGISRPSIYKIPPHLQLPTSLHTPPEAVILAQQLYEEEEAEEERVRLSYSASHFHFSIYKWASADTSLLLPYTSKNKSKRVSASNFQADGDSGARLMKDKKEKKFPSFSAAKFDSNNVENIPAKHSKHSGEEETKVGDKETGLEARKRKSFVYNLLGRQRDADHTAENTTTVKNNVKAFIKIFDSEGVESQPLKPRTRKDKEQPKEPGEGHVTKAVEADQRPDKVVEPVSDENVSSKRKDDLASEAEGSPVLLPDAGDMSFRDIDACFEGIDECLVEELSQSQRKVSEADLYQERILASEAKIREWSRGKEGNIRSLLSTLQYVLWPESGWKPVPLVDIIEGGSVRRAYQKALLCLHPDKLQQKGAEKHQKYVAEKVFNILQDAWTHFSSMSSL